MKIPLSKKTDLLFGITSLVPHDPSKHYFMADFDRDKEETYEQFIDRLLDRIALVLFQNDFNIIYIIKSSEKGAHVVSFDRELPIEWYIDLLLQMGADELFIQWVMKVRYGVLRISRRSSHHQVPELYAICKNGKVKEKPMWIKGLYFNLLFLEKSMFNIRKVRVFNYKGGVKK